MSDANKAPLDGLIDLPREELAKRWEAMFECPAPARVHSNVLRSAIAWHLQIKAHPTWTISRVRKMLSQSGSTLSVQTGTRLIREWQGQTHVVNVLPVGYDYQGRVYKSLSAIAREITGTAWSGPLFFGLKS